MDEKEFSSEKDDARQVGAVPNSTRHHQNRTEFRLERGAEVHKEVRHSQISEQPSMKSSTEPLEKSASTIEGAFILDGGSASQNLQTFEAAQALMALSGRVASSQDKAVQSKITTSERVQDEIEHQTIANSTRKSRKLSRQKSIPMCASVNVKGRCQQSDQASEAAEALMDLNEQFYGHQHTSAPSKLYTSTRVQEEVESRPASEDTKKDEALSGQKSILMKSFACNESHKSQNKQESEATAALMALRAHNAGSTNCSAPFLNPSTLDKQDAIEPHQIPHSPHSSAKITKPSMLPLTNIDSRYSQLPYLNQQMPHPRAVGLHSQFLTPSRIQLPLLRIPEVAIHNSQLPTMHPVRWEQKSFNDYLDETNQQSLKLKKQNSELRTTKEPRAQSHGPAVPLRGSRLLPNAESQSMMQHQQRRNLQHLRSTLPSPTQVSGVLLPAKKKLKEKVSEIQPQIQNLPSVRAPASKSRKPWQSKVRLQGSRKSKAKTMQPAQPVSNQTTQLAPILNTTIQQASVVGSADEVISTAQSAMQYPSGTLSQRDVQKSAPKLKKEKNQSAVKVNTEHTKTTAHQIMDKSQEMVSDIQSLMQISPSLRAPASKSHKSRRLKANPRGSRKRSAETMLLPKQPQSKLPTQLPHTLKEKKQQAPAGSSSDQMFSATQLEIQDPAGTQNLDDVQKTTPQLNTENTMSAAKFNTTGTRRKENQEYFSDIQPLTQKSPSVRPHISKRRRSLIAKIKLPRPLKGVEKSLRPKQPRSKLPTQLPEMLSKKIQQTVSVSSTAQMLPTIHSKMKNPTRTQYLDEVRNISPKLNTEKKHSAVKVNTANTQPSTNEENEVPGLRLCLHPTSLRFYESLILSHLATQRPCPRDPNRRFVLNTYKMPFAYTPAKKSKVSDSVLYRILDSQNVDSIKTVPIDPSEKDDDKDVGSSSEK